MPNNIIIVVGGSTVDVNIKELFENKGLLVEHYNARKSSDLKKQNIPKNTVGAIITVDRSHLVFGNSNELTRILKEKEIPFVFSSGIFATYNSAKILFQKIIKQFPDLLSNQILVNENSLKLDFVKNEWEKSGKKVLTYLDTWLEIVDKLENNLKAWKENLELWKFTILMWKEIQTEETYKVLKKKMNNELSYFRQWKEEIHNNGIEIEKYINILKEWKKDIEKDCNDFISTQDSLKDEIKTINDLNNKKERARLKPWKINFEINRENFNLWEKEVNEFSQGFPLLFEKEKKWSDESKLFYKSLMAKIQEFS